MDAYSLLKLMHILGFILLGAGLCAVFISELRTYGTDDVHVFAEAARYTAVFYDGLTLPGAVLVAVSGLFLILELGYGFFDEPWLVGMWGLFVFEFLEGNTVTRIQFRRTLRISRRALETGRLTEEVRDDARTFLGQFAHFLDLPLFSVIVYCGAIRPATWTDVGWAIAAAVGMTLILMVVVPRLAGRGVRVGA